MFESCSRFQFAHEGSRRRVGRFKAYTPTAQFKTTPATPSVAPRLVTQHGWRLCTTQAPAFLPVGLITRPRARASVSSPRTTYTGRHLHSRQPD